MVYKTPMLQQYQQIKEQYPDCLLFFRLGDFYEMFGDDAKIGSEVLHITLTARDKGGDGKIPMCGVPFHASENYVARLVQAGYKVAICEQMSAIPIESGARHVGTGQGLVKREVVRVVTAGTLLRDESLTESSSQYLLSLVIDPKQVGGAAADLSTGQFLAFSFAGSPEEIIPLLISHFSPREVILPRASYDNQHIVSLIRQERLVNITCAHDWLIYIKDAETMLKKQFQVENLDMFGLAAKPDAIKASAALLGYLHYTQKGRIEHITSIKEFHFAGHLILDQTTLRHLEIVRTAQGDVEGSLFSVLNQTMTAAGQRTLHDWLVHPVTSLEKLQARHDAITELMSRPELVKQAREVLVHVSDIERLVGRMSVGLGSPRDLRRLADTLWHIHDQILPLFSGVKDDGLGLLTQSISPELLDWVNVAREVLFEEAKPTLDEGYIFKEGFHADLDTLRQMTSGNKAWLAEFEEQERNRTGIPKLKAVYSRAFGYAIEVTKPYKDKIPSDYIPRQTLVNAERYTCQALVDYEHKALSAVEEMITLEKRLFIEQVHQVVALSALISQIAQRIGQLDVLLNFAHLARANNYIRPIIMNEIGVHIQSGRHPVIEQLSEAAFVANDTDLGPEKSFQLITGPNMAGKSTYIRQVALIVLMTHTGCFVPALEAKIGLTDRIFTRIGAHDNLRAGQSTFMVEMLETAYILHNATEHSLIILDEVGRGTSPEDGFALAWAITESLAQDNKGLCLFATHFHALKDIVNTLPKVFNSHLTVAVDNEDLIFLRKVTSGPTDESYGIVVAQKAGVPKKIIQRAKKLAEGTSKMGGSQDTNQLSFLAAATQSENTIEHSALAKKLKRIDINNLTPLQGLQLLQDLINQINE